MSMHYLRPDNLDAALAALAEAGDRARVIAGGTDLMIELRKSRLAGRELDGLLVDVSALPELAGAHLEGGALFLGAGLTFAQCQGDPLIAARLPLLAEAARTVGSLQIRNVATLGGNVGNKSPAGDGVTVLAGLGAVVHLASGQGQRETALEELLAGGGPRPGEIIVGFSLDAPAAPRASAFRKVIRRQAVGIARFNIAVQLDPGPDGSLTGARLGLGAVFPLPRRLPEVESLLIAGRPGPALWRAAGKRITELMLDACGARPSMVYKEPALMRVAGRTLEIAWLRGRAGEEASHDA